MSGRILSGHRHDLQLYPARGTLRGHALAALIGCAGAAALIFVERLIG